jgi:hypothetical protein
MRTKGEIPMRTQGEIEAAISEGIGGVGHRTLAYCRPHQEKKAK